MTSTDEQMSPPSPRPQCPPRILEIENLPHVVLRELLPMLDPLSKRTLRLVCQNLRDLIDTQRNFGFNVTLSDDTVSFVLRFNHFDSYYCPRVLLRLQVRTLLSPLKIFSTSLSRCPLPPQIHTLEFQKTKGISQDNFLKLVTFYGRSNYMKKLKVNMMAVVKVEEMKAVKQGLKMNFVEELELTLPHTLDKDISCPRLLLGGSYPSLHTLSVNFYPFGTYFPILYKDFYICVGRNLTSLKVVDVIHPPEYLDPKRLTLANRKNWNKLTAYFFSVERQRKGVQRVAKAFHLRPQTLTKFQEQCDASRVTSLSLNFTRNEIYRQQEQGAILGMTFVQVQRHLVHLHLHNFPTSPETFPVLGELIRNCASTLVTLKLHLHIRKEHMAAENNAHLHLDLGNVGLCLKLKSFVLTSYSFDVWNMAQFDLVLPGNSLENLVLPWINHHFFEGILTGLKQLKSYGFAYPPRQRLELEIIQILLGDEGLPSLEKVTLCGLWWDWRRISDWVKGRGGMQKPFRDVTIKYVLEEVDRFNGGVNSVVFSRAPLI